MKKPKAHMSPSEFTRLLETLFDPARAVTDAAEFLGRDLRTVRRWKHDHHPIPKEVAMLLRILDNPSTARAMSDSLKGKNK